MNYYLFDDKKTAFIEFLDGLIICAFNKCFEPDTAILDKQQTKKLYLAMKEYYEKNKDSS